MKKKISTMPFTGTPEQEAQLKEVIAKYAGDKSNLMAVMQEAQGIYGYLPREVQVMIAEGMEVPLEKVYGVATFYAQFSLSPKGKYKIAVCLGTACYVKGAGEIIEKIKDGAYKDTFSMLYPQKTYDESANRYTYLLNCYKELYGDKSYEDAAKDPENGCALCTAEHCQYDDEDK